LSAVAEQAHARSRTGDPGLPVVAYEPWRHGVLPRLQEIWTFRQLIGYTSVQFILKRYRQTYLGWFWIFLRPGLQIVATTFFFGGVLGVNYGDRPAAVYVAFSMAAWGLFERTFHWGMRSVRMTRALSKGLHMPRSLAVVSAGAPALVDFLIHSIVAIGIVIYYQFALNNHYFAAPQRWLEGLVGIVLLLGFGLSSGLFTGPLMIITKEVRYIQVYLLQFWMFVTPVVYAQASSFQKVVELNPLTAPVQMVTDGFLATGRPATVSLVSTLIGLTVMVVGGLIFASRFERVAVARL